MFTMKQFRIKEMREQIKKLIKASEKMDKSCAFWCGESQQGALPRKVAVELAGFIQDNLRSGGVLAGKPFEDHTPRTKYFKDYFGYTDTSVGKLSGTMINGLQGIHVTGASYVVGWEDSLVNARTIPNSSMKDFYKKRKTGSNIPQVNLYAARFEFGVTGKDGPIQNARPFFFPAVKKWFDTKYEGVLSETIMKDMEEIMKELYIIRAAEKDDIISAKQGQFQTLSMSGHEEQIAGGINDEERDRLGEEGLSGAVYGAVSRGSDFYSSPEIDRDPNDMDSNDIYGD